MTHIRSPRDHWVKINLIVSPTFNFLISACEGISNVVGCYLFIWTQFVNCTSSIVGYFEKKISSHISFQIIIYEFMLKEVWNKTHRTFFIIILLNHFFKTNLTNHIFVRTISLKNQHFLVIEFTSITFFLRTVSNILRLSFQSPSMLEN